MPQTTSAFRPDQIGMRCWVALSHFSLLSFTVQTRTPTAIDPLGNRREIRLQPRLLCGRKPWEQIRPPFTFELTLDHLVDELEELFLRVLGAHAFQPAPDVQPYRFAAFGPGIAIAQAEINVRHRSSIQIEVCLCPIVR